MESDGPLGARGARDEVRTWTGEMTLAAKHLLHFLGFDRRRGDTGLFQPRWSQRGEAMVGMSASTKEAVSRFGMRRLDTKSLNREAFHVSGMALESQRLWLACFGWA